MQWHECAYAYYTCSENDVVVATSTIWVGRFHQDFTRREIFSKNDIIYTMPFLYKLVSPEFLEKLDDIRKQNQFQRYTPFCHFRENAIKRLIEKRFLPSPVNNMAAAEMEGLRWL